MSSSSVVCQVRNRDLDAAPSTPDRTPAIRAWFADAGYREFAFDTEDRRWFGIGTNRLDAEPRPFRSDRPMFRFRGSRVDAHY
jgi:hypothetical protein